MGLSHEDAEKSAKESLELVGIDSDYYYVSPLELSGGQKRCVAIAGVLAMNPKILVMDEPSSALDAESELMVHKALKELMKDRLVIMVSHRDNGESDFDRVVTL